MCLLIVKPAGAAVAIEVIQRALVEHPDGAGIAWAEDGRTWMIRDLAWRPHVLYREIKRRRHCPMIVHFRWATHGHVSVENTHPFWLADGAIAHNGVIPIARDKSESDTRAFVRAIEGMTVAELRSCQEAIEDYVGPTNKLASVHNSGETLVFNRAGFVEYQGCLHSNTSGIPVPRGRRSDLDWEWADGDRWSDRTAVDDPTSDPFYWRDLR